MDNIVACICEGAAEQAIIEILLEKDALIFEKTNLLDDKVIRVRKAENFERDYLRKYFDKKIIIYRILDSRNEVFKLSKPYQGKIKVINVITAPEIEMLVIHSEDKYDDFKKSGITKPSDYCKQKLGIKQVKNYNFVKEYFSTGNRLIRAIEDYKKKAHIRKGEVILYSLLKKWEFK